VLEERVSIDPEANSLTGNHVDSKKCIAHGISPFW
jgi:hypothetical protein